MNQHSIVSVMKSMIPITRFNKGEASKIFDEVEHSGTKVVIKNNKPACVLISPTQYETLMELLSDYYLAMEAERRMEQNDDKENLSREEVMRSFGITEEDLQNINVVIE